MYKPFVFDIWQPHTLSFVSIYSLVMVTMQKSECFIHLEKPGDQQTSIDRVVYAVDRPTPKKRRRISETIGKIF